MLFYLLNTSILSALFRFPCKYGLANSPTVLFLHPFQNRTSLDKWNGIFTGLVQQCQSTCRNKKTEQHGCILAHDSLVHNNDTVTDMYVHKGDTDN